MGPYPPQGVEVLRRAETPSLMAPVLPEPIGKSGHGEAPPRAPKGRPGPERSHWLKVTQPSQELESAISLPCNAQLPLALKPQSQEGLERDCCIQDADGVVPQGLWFLVPAPPSPPLPSSVRLLTFTSDPSRYLISATPNPPHPGTQAHHTCNVQWYPST